MSDPDTTNSMQRVYPGFPVHGLQDSVRYTGQGSLRSTVSSNMVNEFRFGKTGGATQVLARPDRRTCSRAPGFGGMNGYAIAWNGFKSITNPYPARANSAREGKTMVFEDTLNWVKGRHCISTGFSYTKATSGSTTQHARCRP